MRQMGRLDNFGIRRAERLDGNVGYLDVRRIPIPANAGPAITAAMELVAGTYALILDLRHNGGGAPEGVLYWCSYLLDEKPIHLNDIYHADTDETRQFWTLPYLPGTRYVDYVADDLYSQNFNAYWKGMQPLYNYGKPFILAEWAPWGNDDPSFVSKVFNWVSTHPRTAALVYFDYASTFDLGSKPRSLSAYRTLAARARFNTTA